MNTVRSGVFLSVSLLIAALAALAAAPAAGAGESDAVSLDLLLAAPAFVVSHAALVHRVQGAGAPKLDGDPVRVPDGAEVPISLDVRFRAGAAMAVGPGCTG